MNRRLLTAAIVWVVIVLGLTFVVGFSGKSDTDNCADRTGTHHYSIVISHDKVAHPNLLARKCDSITFTNQDSVVRGIAFGPHDNHIAYDGITERLLNRNESFSITLIQVGTYHWHDHLHDDIQGNFTVK